MANQDIIKTNHKLFNYLYLQESPTPADAIIGFGHFDMKIPETCANLFKEGYADRIILTGGIGAGTADLGKAEADAFLSYLHEKHPQVNAQHIFTENKSTNTGENIRFTLQLLKEKNPTWYKKVTNGRLLLVANPFRQRRVFLTTAQLLPNAHLINCPPKSNYEKEVSLFKTKNQSLDEQLPGEIQRILDYPSKGWIKQESVPREILELIK